MKSLSTIILLVLSTLSVDLYAQCTLGSTAITWEAATTGSATVIPTASSAGGPPAAVTSAIPGCTNTNSKNPFNFTTTITQDGNAAYDAIRSGTNGAYGQPYFTLYMDNVDGGCTTCNSTTNPVIPIGTTISANFNFEFPVELNLR